jgi:hypothetical protein
MKESELAEHIIKYFEKKGYECYKEVSKNGRGGSARNDCYFVKKENNIIIETIAVETKMSMNTTVMYQAKVWLKMANKVYIGVPKATRKDFKQRKFLYDICKNYLGIGIIEMDKKTFCVEELITPFKVNHKPTLPPLYEAQKDSIAGNDKGKFVTAFSNTVSLIHEFMEDKEVVELKEVVKGIKHHYKSDASAISSLRKYIGTSVIPEYTLIEVDKKWYIDKI